MPRRYQVVSAAKASGATYTPPPLAAFVARQVAHQIAQQRHLGAPLRVLDPAVGDGELLVNLVSALRQRGFTTIGVTGYDLDDDALSIARDRLERLPLRDLTLHPTDFLRADSPAVSQTPGFDAIIANPPYVRAQILGGKTAQKIAQRHGLTGRIDLYQAFVVTLSDWLSSAGVAGVITSNRFLTVRAGRAVRRHLWSRFTIHHVWDLGDTRCFGAAVLPAVTLLEKGRCTELAQKNPRMTTVYETSTKEEPVVVDSLFDALGMEGVVTVKNERAFDVRQGRVTTSMDGSDVWRLSTPAVDAWLGTVAAHTWKTFGDLGKIRVGIKTTADRVFIRSDWDAIETGVPELLRPITTHHTGRRYKAQPVQRRVLYTHTVVGGKRRAVELAEHPNAAVYLETYRAKLAGRTYLTRAKRAWFEIWVPHDPMVWQRPKLVFRDIAERPQFWIDFEGTVVNGDCYWMALESEDVDLLWLAVAVGNSEFISAFYDKRFNNKLYAGRRRFITQYVRHFPLPDPAHPTSQHIIRLARHAYAVAEDAAQVRALQAQLDVLVGRAFGVQAPFA